MEYKPKVNIIEAIKIVRPMTIILASGQVINGIIGDYFINEKVTGKQYFQDAISFANNFLVFDYVNLTALGLTFTTAALTVITPTNTKQLVPVYTPTTADNKLVTYVSDNPAKVTVDANGLITAVAVGTANITVTSTEGGFTAVCIVTVT